MYKLESSAKHACSLSVPESGVWIPRVNKAQGGKEKTLHQIYKNSYLHKIYMNYKVMKMKGKLFNKTKASSSQRDTFRSVVLF